ncbi:MAG: carboxypeptidase-like regulatory domain-containing protein [Planctomycetota bacterium]
MNSHSGHLNGGHLNGGHLNGGFLNGGLLKRGYLDSGRAALLVMGVLAVMTAALGVAWWRLPKGFRPAPPPAAPVSEATPAAGASAPATGAQPVDPQVHRELAGTASPETYEPRGLTLRGTGTVRLRVVDAESGKALPHLGFAVNRVTGRSWQVGHGLTDKDGRALLTELGAGLLVIVSERSPPYAASEVALVLTEDHIHDVTLRVTRGGRIEGRVVDGAGAPVAGAEVSLVEAATTSAERRSGPLAVTDAAGRYAIEAVANRPGMYHLVAGKPEPKGEAVVRVEAVKATRAGTIACHPQPGVTTHVPDIVLPSERVIAGRVLDSERVPVAGALVSRRPEGRRDQRAFEETGPIGGTFRSAGPGEALSDSAGFFALATVEQPQTLLVWTRTGA